VENCLHLHYAVHCRLVGALHIGAGSVPSRRGGGGKARKFPWALDRLGSPTIADKIFLLYV